MIDFSNPHLQHPTSLAPARDFAPALSIYIDTDDTWSLQVTDAHVNITFTTADDVSVLYIGRSLEEVASEISASSTAVKAHAHAVIHALRADYLFYDPPDVTPDGGVVLRMRSHIVRYTEETRIHALKPYEDHRLNPWYPLVDRGNVVIHKDGVRFVYSIPEYQDQEWDPYYGAPFVRRIGERARFINPKTIQVPRRPLFWYRNNIAITINSQPVGMSIVNDVDIHNGVILLKADVAQDDSIFVDYTYREKRLVYKGVNLNPSMEHNPGIVDQAVLLYMRPTVSSVGQERTQTVFHKVSTTISGAISQIESTTEPALIIGAFQVRPNGAIEDVDVTDTRTRGGGVKDERLEGAVMRNSEVQSVADHARYDGFPFPAPMSGIMRLPTSVKDTLGEEYIDRVVARHLALGGNVLLEFTDDLEV